MTVTDILIVPRRQARPRKPESVQTTAGHTKTLPAHKGNNRRTDSKHLRQHSPVVLVLLQQLAISDPPVELSRTMSSASRIEYSEKYADEVNEYR